MKLIVRFLKNAVLGGFFVLLPLVLLYLVIDEMLELVRKASLCGLPSTIHAIGDLAVRNVLDVYETVRKEEADRFQP